MAAEKISVSLETELIDWLRKRADATDATVSAVIAKAVIAARQHEARVRVLEHLGGSVSEKELNETRALLDGPGKMRKPARSRGLARESLGETATTTVQYPVTKARKASSGSPRR